MLFCEQTIPEGVTFGVWVTFHHNRILCPWCNEVYDDTELTEGSVECLCDVCGKQFQILTEVTRTHKIRQRFLPEESQEDK